MYYSESTRGLYTDDTPYIKKLETLKYDGPLYQRSAAEWQKANNPGWQLGFSPELEALTLLWTNFAK